MQKRNTTLVTRQFADRAQWTTRLVGLFILTTLALAPCGIRAQIAGTANIQGTVTDTTGAVVSGAGVTLNDEATGVKRTTKSDGSGVYLFPGVPIGTYDVLVTASGFKTYEQKGIVLEVGSSISVNATLAVGSKEQTIEVQAEALALQTEDATFKQTIDNTAMDEMPLNGRQMTALITLSGGSSAAPSGDFTGSKYSYQTISVSIAGGGGNTTLWRFDGGDNQDYMANGNLPYAFPDAISQFSVESTDLGAQDGGHVGGLVNVVTKSGTNQYHGEGFEFIRNNYIDSTNFFSTTPDTLHQNQYGGTFGGPIKRNKMFAFAAYQRWKADQSQSATSATVPTAANLTGDFSVTDGNPLTGTNLCNSTGKPIPLVDPLTGTTLVGNQYPSTPTYSAPALALQKYLPVPNATVDPDNCGFVRYAIPYLLTDNQFDTRVDFTASSRQNIYGRYFIDGYQFPAYFSPTNILITTQSGNIERVQTFVLGDAWTITNNVVNAAHISILRRVDNRGYNAGDINAATLGIPSSALYQIQPNGLQMAEGKFSIGGGTNSVAHFNDNTGSIDDDVTWVHGKHQIGFGGEWVQNQLNIGNVYEGNGIFTFNGEYSGSGPKGGSTIGDQNLDFLMGTLGSSTPFQQSKKQQNALRGPIPSLYVQDTYHATPRLTLVGGLRWGPEILPVDYFNRGVEFNMADFIANKSSSVYPNAPAGALYYGDPGVSRQFTSNHLNQFSPNVGLSFDPVGNGKTVIRAGGALMWDNPNFFTSQRNQQNPPFATAVTNVQTSSSGPIPFAAPWSTGAFTTSPFPQPAIPTPSQALFFAQSQYIVTSPNFRPAYTIQWTLSIQREFGHGWQAQVDYIGNATRHDPMGITFDPAVFIPGVWGASGAGCAGIVTTGPAAVKPGAAGTNCSTTGNESSRFLLTQENPTGANANGNPTGGNQYEGSGGGSVMVGDGASANYNGLVSSINHRLSGTFSIFANWTWSKCLNIYDAQGDYAGTGPENPYNPGLDYGPCGSDYRHIENVSLVAKSAFNNHLNNAEKWLVNGWELAPLIHITTGSVINVTSGQDNSLTDVGNDRPNRVPGVNPYAEAKFKNASGETNREYLNPSAFQQVWQTAGCASVTAPNCPALGTYGNLSRNAFYGPKFLQFDAQISRIFPIHETWTTTLRLEAFNVLNHPDFSNPGAGLTSSTFGQVSGQANAARVFQGSVKV
ncbi:MAG: carboxypeptidase regulatory-like domain-containing protein, partial [Terracidiphilus sp.]